MPLGTSEEIELEGTVTRFLVSAEKLYVRMRLFDGGFAELTANAESPNYSELKKLIKQSVGKLLRASGYPIPAQPGNPPMSSDTRYCLALTRISLQLIAEA